MHKRNRCDAPTGTGTGTCGQRAAGSGQRAAGNGQNALFPAAVPHLSSLSHIHSSISRRAQAVCPFRLSLEAIRSGGGGVGGRERERGQRTDMGGYEG